MENGKATLDMTYYVKKLLEGHNNLQPKATPGGRVLPSLPLIALLAKMKKSFNISMAIEVLQ